MSRTAVPMMHVIVIQCELQNVLCCPGQRAELLCARMKSMRSQCTYSVDMSFALQEGLKPQKSVCGLHCSTLSLGIRSVAHHRRIKSTETFCHVSHNKFFLSSRFTWLHVPNTRITSYNVWSPPLKMHPSSGNMTHTGISLFDFSILRT